LKKEFYFQKSRPFVLALQIEFVHFLQAKFDPETTHLETVHE